MAKKTETLKVASTEPVGIIDESPEVTKESSAKSEDDKVPEISKENEGVDDTEEVALNDDKEETSKQPSPSAKAEEAKQEATEEEEGEAPPQPPRPVDPIQQITQDLQDAFPNIEEKIITAVLIASQGNPDPAFNALLYISDPSFKPEIPAPQISTGKSGPTGAVAAGKGAAPRHELTDDELLARQLQKEFELEDARRRRRHQDKSRRTDPGRKQQRPIRHSQEQDHDFDEESPDEFEQIKETFTQGLEEARTTLNGWVSGLAKKFDSATGKNENPNPNANKENPKLFGALGGSSYKRQQAARFDEDPEIIAHDFHDRIQLSNNDFDDGSEENPSLPNRPKGETDKTSGENKTASDKKWQPLDSGVPANSDAFLVTDSEEEELTAPAPPPKN
ncbi:CUE5 [[Candida] subhashii]|uniref:CUE5 n=1 Tax=[Candida] subhashii TaxID=561895 RepID=A0A8J5QJ66_9ASCO|nr:CUE5 [[Candida] subhashii]KAG7664032.1 CUE5 [[Candida] subhashii]